MTITENGAGSSPDHLALNAYSAGASTRRGGFTPCGSPAEEPPRPGAGAAGGAVTRLLPLRRAQPGARGPPPLAPRPSTVTGVWTVPGSAFAE